MIYLEKDFSEEQYQKDRAELNVGAVGAAGAIAEFVEKSEATQDGEPGVWRTVHGRRIFIREGEDAKTAFNRDLQEEGARFEQRSGQPKPTEQQQQPAPAQAPADSVDQSDKHPRERSYNKTPEWKAIVGDNIMSRWVAYQGGTDDPVALATQPFIRWKLGNDAAAKLEERTGVQMLTAKHIMRAWQDQGAQFSTNGQIREAAAAEFGIQMNDWEKKSIAEQDTQVAEMGDVQKVLRGMYDATQEMFKEKGITHVTVYRGVSAEALKGANVGEGDTVDLDGNTLDSWSLNPAVASFFGVNADKNGGIVLEARIPVEQVLSTPRTGMGRLNETEIVVMDSKPIKARAYGAW